MDKTLVPVAALAIAVLTALVNSPAVAAYSAPISGVWITERMSHVTIRKCGSGLCGYISKVVVPPKIYKKHKAAIDKIGTDNVIDYYNKDPKLRDRRLKGLQVLTLSDREAENKFRGEVYDPEDGNTYTGVLEVLDKNTIRLTGCGFFDLICRSEDWSRVH